MPLKELERLKAVNRFLRLEFSKEKELQEIVDMAALICGASIALITLIDQDTQHIKFRTGFDRNSTPRADAFCDHLLDSKDAMIIPDAQLDERFLSNPLVIGEPHIRFYAGSPLYTSDGHGLGSLLLLINAPGN